ncbi:molybdopterin-dependent oxidoreductase [Algicella marina]|uniref:Molybdopterin-dependent oxidoreductase n=1 Tax=Algicella marina TaxID=2683284 RepID=A0A6P1T5Q4_9RHOB|nr:molybdopterin cofactor-binding domain-containing protein [Algicella marina]QHQ37085.1 molybdopterin-dependent oxidoreductase [Algicella marina]
MDKASTTDYLRFTLNGRRTCIECRPAERLSTVLRQRLNAREVKVGCGAGDCGSCTVLLDGEAVCACLMSARQASGRQVETVGSLVVNTDEGRRLAAAFHREGAAQCGICTPGMIVAATALLKTTRAPTEEAVKDALGGVLCRCTGYRKIIRAVRTAFDDLAEETDGGVGSRLLRLDGWPKVDGSERFGDDVAPASALCLKIIRSPFARAGFSFGDLETHRRNEGLTAILTASDIPGRNAFGVIPGFADQPVLAEGEARFRGEAVAAIVGAPETLASYQVQNFPVEWKELVADLHPSDALVSSNLLHADRSENILCRGVVRRGDPAKALADAAEIVEGSFATSFVEHAYIEPEAGYAEMKDRRIIVHACTQAPVMDQEAVAEIMGLPMSDIRIVPTAVGGGFGSKLDISVQPLLALAAWKTGRTVRLTYSRQESMQSTTKRHPAEMRMKIGVDGSGRITAMEFEGTFNTGAYASWGPTVANRVPVHASGPYRVPNYSARSLAVYTNNPPAGAFRGFGVPQAALMQETLFDDLAQKLGLDPLEFRINNALENGAETVCGQVFKQGVGIGACLKALREQSREARSEVAEWNRQAKSRGEKVRRGVGVAAGWYGCGNTSLPNPSTIRAGLRADGKLVLHQGAMDIGQGSNTVIPQIFAQALGVTATCLEMVGADTDLTPDAGKTSASRQTFVSGAAALRAGEAMRARILERCNAGPEAVISCEGGTVLVTDGENVHSLDLSLLPVNHDGYVFEVAETYDPPTSPLDSNGQGAPYAQFGYAAHLAIVEVDESLGLVKPLKFVAAHDVGRAINPLLIEGQVEGGIAQGLGMALMEEYVPGRTENLHDYLIPTIGDMPPVETLIIEEPDAHGPFGAKGLGEHVLIPTAPALLNAIADATGVRMKATPVTPSALFSALQARNG